MALIMALRTIDFFRIAIIVSGFVPLLFAESNVTIRDKRNKHSQEHFVDYGVDVSFPMHHGSVFDEEFSPLPGRQEFYNNFLKGCIKYYGKEGRECLITEEQRIAMSLRQPQSMKNYTELGFKKIRAPESLFTLISAYWKRNKDNESEEEWGTGETFTNHWASPTYMVSVEDTGLRAGGKLLMKKIWREAKRTLEQWTDQVLKPTSLYGIRVYKTNSVLATHVDRRPLVTSAIINVDSDLDEPWPLEVIGHDGKARNVTMEPGDMVLYESHSVLHGRPFPLKGRYVANIFIHFEPTGESLSQEQDGKVASDIQGSSNEDDDNGFNYDYDYGNRLPPYIIHGSPEAYWFELEKKTPKRRTPLHRAAERGDLDRIKRLFEKGRHPIDAQDENGWTPLLEASRGGHTEVVKFLLENGAEVNRRTPEAGDTALGLTREFFGDDHPLIQLLIDAGAIDFGPEL